MRITIAIATYNRKKYVSDCASSLAHVNGINEHNVKIYDDNSNEYDIDFLKEMFPFAKKIILRKENVGASKNIFLIFRDFIESGDDILFMADSDLVFRNDCLKLISENINFTDGFLSLYNSMVHEPIDEFNINNVAMVQKNDVGSAGTAFSKKIIKEILQNIPEDPEISYDWAWSNYLSKKKDQIRMLVTKKCYVQHFGFKGYNCDVSRIIDFGENFNSTDLASANILEKHTEELISTIKNIGIRNEEKSYSYKVGRFILFPIIQVKRLLKGYK